MASRLSMPEDAAFPRMHRATQTFLLYPTRSGLALMDMSLEDATQLHSPTFKQGFDLGDRPCPLRPMEQCVVWFDLTHWLLAAAHQGKQE